MSFASFAGRKAKTGIDAPSENIKGRSHAGETVLLSIAAAMTLSITKEGQAADPNVTILDEDSIAYKDMPHGAFELVTKEAIPRYILIEDPGVSVVLNRSGSTIIVNQFTNSTSRLEELEAAQREVMANLAKELGPPGSSTPPLVDRLPVQPINFTQPDSPGELESLPALPVSSPALMEAMIIRPSAPAPTLTLALGAGPSETDTVVFDTFTATSGVFSASSSSGGALTYGIGGGTAGNTALDGVTYNVSQEGNTGTLYLNSTTGAYTFVPDDNAINALKAPTTESFVITVSDGTMSASQTFTIDIDGVNDDAIVAGNVTGSVSEAADVASGARLAAAHAPRVATGTLTSADVDDTPNAFTAVSSATASDRGYGTFTMTADGVWVYTLDDSNDAVQALNVGDTLTDTFTVTTIDGTEQVVTIVIGGRNDAAVISGDTTGVVVEAACKDPGVPTATGTLTAIDIDNPFDTFTAVKCGKSDGGYGTFTMTSDGVWTYTLDNDNCAVQALEDCDTLTDTFTVTTEDGTEQLVTVTIQGADDGHDRHHHHHHHHKHSSDHEKSTHEPSTAAVFEVETGTGKAASEEVNAAVATKADTNVVPSSNAAPEHIPAAAQDLDRSFQFKDDGSADSPRSDVVPDCGCFSLLVVDLGGLPDRLMGWQASAPTPPEIASGHSFQFKESISSDAAIVPDGEQQRGCCHLSYDLEV
jgi:VCBS repeat-containing protein